MDLSGDDLAGVVDLFGALTRAELRRAVEELAFRRGTEVAAEDLAARVEAAVEEYRLVTVEGDGDPLLAPGPVAFPALPEGAEDLPHIMDVEARDLDREALDQAVAQRLADEAEAAAEAGDAPRAEDLLDVAYDAEAWAGREFADVRERLSTVVDGERGEVG